MQDLKSLPAPVLKAIAKLADNAMKGRRDELGQDKAEFEVDQTVVIHCKGTVKVSRSTPDALVPQSARPWALLTVALQQLNRVHEALGIAGTDVARLIQLAETVDPELAKRTQEEADRLIRDLKEPTRQFKWGAVSVVGDADVLAVGDHLANKAADDE